MAVAGLRLERNFCVHAERASRERTAKYSVGWRNESDGVVATACVPAHSESRVGRICLLGGFHGGLLLAGVGALPKEDISKDLREFRGGSRSPQMRQA